LAKENVTLSMAFLGSCTFWSTVDSRQSTVDSKDGAAANCGLWTVDCGLLTVDRLPPAGGWNKNADTATREKE
jgi:hypothetical protein